AAPRAGGRMGGARLRAANHRGAARTELPGGAGVRWRRLAPARRPARGHAPHARRGGHRGHRRDGFVRVDGELRPSPLPRRVTFSEITRPPGNIYARYPASGLPMDTIYGHP